MLKLALLLAAGAAVNVAAAWGEYAVFWRTQHFTNIGDQSSTSAWAPNEPDEMQCAFVHVAGWPLVAWTRRETIIWPLTSSLLPRPSDEFWLLKPAWPGFAVNTLFYAGALWLACRSPFALRRLIRRRRGGCPACGYPIGARPACTQCGAAIAASNR